MTTNPTGSAIAIEELQRIDGAIAVPVLLVGGMAVQQYCAGGDSKDLDIICSYNVAGEIMQKLYPRDRWQSEDGNTDDHRPSIRITHRTEDRGEIVLGPKILERENNKYINWVRLNSDTRPFKWNDREFHKIQVPSPTSLAFILLLSYIDKKQKNEKKKSRQDLQDFITLSNDPGFSMIRFASLVGDSGATQPIRNALLLIGADEHTLFDRTALSQIQSLFGIKSDDVRIVDVKPSSMKPISREIEKIAHKYRGKTLQKTSARELVLVVGVQNDFCEGGALAAQDTKSLIEPLNGLIRKAEETGMQIVFARDWHPHDHDSFKDWGPHCVKDTPGAEFHPDLYKPSGSLIVDTGTSNEMDGYSPFQDPVLLSVVSSPTLTTIYIVGLALEFCILAACRDAVWFGKRVIAVEPCIRSASLDASERETVWNLIESFGVVRKRNAP